MINGFLNINKPDGITSFGVVAKIKKRFDIKKVGHMGTLDPAGGGVLPLAVGKATKLFDLMQQKRKTYRAIFVFGKETDTLDAEGKIIKEDNKILNKLEIDSVLHNFIGKINQIPPNFSAKKVGGKRAYELARNNQAVNLEPKEVEIFRFEIIEEVKQNMFLFEIECSSGTYVRSLCRDLAYKLNTVAYMPLIIRTSCDSFRLENSIPLNKTLNDKFPIQDYLIPIEKVFVLDMIELNENDYKKIRNGLSINISNSKDGLKYLLFENNVFAIGKISKDKLKMEIYLDD